MINTIAFIVIITVTILTIMLPLTLTVITLMTIMMYNKFCSNNSLQTKNTCLCRVSLLKYALVYTKLLRLQRWKNKTSAMSSRQRFALPVVGSATRVHFTPRR